MRQRCLRGPWADWQPWPNGQGENTEATLWRQHERAVRDAFAREFVSNAGVVGNGSHTSYILGLGLGLIPDQVGESAGKRLVRSIRERGTLLTSGFLGTPLALDALADIGETELAYPLLLRTDYPSWGYMVEQGATIWERWNGNTGDVAMNSFNHYALGAVCAFLYRRVCGIEPVEPGFSVFRVAPLPDPRIPSARARYDGVRGMIEAGWRWAGSRLEITVEVPPNSQAQLALPGPPAEGPKLITHDENTDLTCGLVGPGRHWLVTVPSVKPRGEIFSH